ncbi:hypothetical protein [Roseovarius sp. MMSF_3281]|uniref:DUF4376 domain-containing protein n=1 Tax=Roseovarius sp. MMSF_3281 TaxID=3046694 RepID=UPI00273F18D3|nr:hypothetical protein [Roseovarius sp. MMSF_3281]
MPVFKAVDGVVVRVWRDVASIEEFHDKYGEEEGLQEGEALPGQLWDGENLTNPLPPVTADQVDHERTRRLEAGAALSVTGISDPIPLTGRNFDRTVYLGLLAKAQGYKAAGTTDPVLRVRDRDNVIHMLTPDQMIELITQAMNWFEDIMAISWAMKDGTAPFEAGIPQDVTADAHWVVS